MPDAIEMLIQDHREVESLFERYERSADPALAEEICTELTVHSAVEEKVVYPKLSQDVDGGDGMRSHSEQEHRQVKELIFELQKVGLSGPQASALMAKLKTAVEEHVQEEEQEVLPKMRAALGPERLEDLGREAAKTKKSLVEEAQAGGPLIDLTKDELYELAQERGVDGRSGMDKDQLIAALRRP